MLLALSIRAGWAESRTEEYVYDAAGRLAAAHWSTSAVPDTTFLYQHDAAGNRVRTAVYGARETNTDYDADGIADLTEIAWFASLVYGPLDDPDGDRCDNANELAAGTSLTNPASFLGMQGTALPVARGGAGIVINWASATGRHYQLERATNLAGGFPFTVRTNIPAAPPMNVETARTATDGRLWFYRVRLAP